jgi:hypothetical protein
MLNRRLGMNPINNPLIESPFVQQDNIDSEFNPITQNTFLFLSGAPFLLLNGQNFDLLL